MRHLPFPVRSEQQRENFNDLEVDTIEARATIDDWNESLSIQFKTYEDILSVSALSLIVYDRVARLNHAYGYLVASGATLFPKVASARAKGQRKPVFFCDDGTEVQTYCAESNDPFAGILRTTRADCVPGTFTGYEVLLVPDGHRELFVRVESGVVHWVRPNRHNYK